ncbi:MAG: hypothetical protein MI922_08695, partial [Bacteroidales bacterium]|nr:hypothetical protein [Bacteroidales bacterium]
SQPDRFEKQYTFLEENSNIGLVSSRVRHVAKDVEQQTMLDSVIWSNKVVTHEEISVSRFVEPPVVHSTVFYRKELIEKYGEYQPGDFPTDYEMCLRLLEKGVIMEKLPDYLVEWYDYPERSKRNDDRFNMQAFYEIKSHYLYRYLNEQNAWQPFVVVWGAGRVSRRYFSYLHELGIWPKFFIDIHANEERNVIQYKHTPPAGNHFILSYVTNRGARENIREFLVDLGYIEGKDFLCL